jgi:hypothetical protein
MKKRLKILIYAKENIKITALFIKLDVFERWSLKFHQFIHIVCSFNHLRVTVSFFKNFT